MIGSVPLNQFLFPVLAGTSARNDEIRDNVTREGGTA
jgi:hypothetical protein